MPIEIAENLVLNENDSRTYTGGSNWRFRKVSGGPVTVEQAGEAISFDDELLLSKSGAVTLSSGDESAVVIVEASETPFESTLVKKKVEKKAKK